MLRVLPLIAPRSLPIAAISPVRTQTEASFLLQSRIVAFYSMT